MTKILTVDDSVSMQQQMDLTLSKGGFEIVQASNGEEAIKFLNIHSDIELIILDLHMPVMNGFQMLEKLKNENIFQKIPIFILTTSNTSEHKNYIKSFSNVRAWIIKPFDPLKLVAGAKKITKSIQKNRRVLIVDDSASIRDFVQKIFESKKIEVVTAQNGVHALEQIEAHKDLGVIFLDLHMPIMNGIDLLQKLAVKKFLDGKKIPVIMLTTELKKEFMDQAKELGVTAWMTKPPVAENILKVYKKIVDSDG